MSKKERGLGFKNLCVFNAYMVGKQFWRLCNEPQSIWAQVLKSPYIPNCSALEAEKRYKPPWIWSSILEGKKVILEGKMAF